MKKHTFLLIVALLILATVGTGFFLNRSARKESAGSPVTEIVEAEKATRRIPAPAPRGPLPEVFAQTATPAPVKPFPRGENSRRGHAAPVTREVPPGLRDRSPAVLAKSPEDGRFQLLPEETDLHTLHARRMVLDVSALDRVIAGKTARLTAPTTGPEVLTLVIQSVKTRSAQSQTMIGRVEGEEDASDVQLVYHDGIIHGTVSRYRSDQHLEYRILADGYLMVRELDPSTMTAPCGKAGESPEEACNHLHDELSADGIQLEASPAGGNPAPDTPGWTTIDVVVGYDIAARIEDGGTSQIEARIISEVDRMSTAFSNSLVTDTEVMLLGTIEDPDYIFPGVFSDDMGEELDYLNNPVDGQLDTVSDYATELGADLKSFVLKEVDGSAGIAYLPGSSSIVARDYMTSSRITFAHELGHNLGCDHSWGDSSQNYHSRYGWRLDPPAAARVRTIMAYDWNWGTGTRIPYFSNPAVSYLGAATGAVNGYNVLNDATADQRYYKGGLGYFGSDPNKFGFNGTFPALGANNAGLIKNGGSSSSYGATFASNRATRSALAVTSPAGGEIWSVGTNRTIRFTGGDMDDTATVELYKGGVLQSTVVSGINATNKIISWDIPPGETGGADYMIRVTLDDPITGPSSADSGNFTLIGDIPSVIAQTPATDVVSGSLSQVSVTFSEPMNPATFSAATDILSFTGPTGNNLMAAITGTSWNNGNTELVITFPNQIVTGYYRIVLSPAIEDMSGETLDMDFDGISGEIPEDGYAALYRVSADLEQTIWSSLVGNAGVEDGVPGIASGGTWNLGEPNENPPSGPSSSADGGHIIAQRLNGNYDVAESSYLESVPINCTGFTNVSLTFKGWAGVGKDDILYIDAWDGFEWQRIHTISSTTTTGYNDQSWKTYAPLLFEYADENPDFKLRWGLTNTTFSNLTATGWQIDAIKLRGDGPPLPPPAPRVVSHSPNGSGSANHASVWLEFSQPMDESGFTLEDISSFTGPAGGITATGFDWVSDSLLRIDFPEQSASGDYTLVMNPDVPDVFGQPLNQDSDGTPGESGDDGYSAQFSIQGTPVPPSGLAATAVSSTQIGLSWTDNSPNESGFKLQRSATGGDPWIQIAVIAENAVSYVDANLDVGSTWHYRLAATNSFGDSGFTTPASATTWTHGEAWRMLYFGQTGNSGDAADLHDFDRDGQNNLIERAFVTNPTSAASRYQPVVFFIPDGDSHYLALTYRQLMGGSGAVGVDYKADGITYAVLHDTDMSGPWNTGGLTFVSSQDNTPSPGIQTVTVRRDVHAAGAREFLRLKFTAD